MIGNVVLLYRGILIAILFACMIPFTGCSGQTAKAKQINVIFRFDDYSAKSSMDTELKIIDAFRKNKVPVTFAVIPFVCAGSEHDPSPQNSLPLTPTKGNILKAALKSGILDVALHGYAHQIVSVREMNEFSGLDYGVQAKKLAEGKKFLEALIDAPVTTFVPPWNAYDLNTLRVLEDLGFSTLSASKAGKAEKTTTLNFLPATCELPQLRNAIGAARNSSDTQPVIVVVFHEYDFREFDKKHGKITYQEFSDLLRGLRSTEDVRLLSIGQATGMINDLTVSRFLLNRSIHTALNLLPSFLVKVYDSRYTDRDHGYSWLCAGLFYVTIILLVALVSFAAGRFMFPRSAFLMNVGIYGSIPLLVTVLVYVFHDLDVTIGRAMIGALIVGISVGTWLCIPSLAKKTHPRKTGPGDENRA